MAGVVVWCFKKNKSLWYAYGPNVSCELERLFSLDTQQTVQLGTISQSLSCYQINFAQMTQVTIRSGSVREVQRIVCDPASAIGKGVMWEFEGDTPSHWEAYDLNTMNVIEEGFPKGNLLSPSLLNLQQSRVQLPYVIDFGTMTQMRVETGRVRRIQRRALNHAYSPSVSHPSGGASSTLQASSMFPGQGGWQPGSQTHRIPVTRSKHRHQPYTAPAVNGAFNGLSVQSSQPSSAVQQQLPLQNTAPLTRRKLQQTTGGSHTSSLHQYPYMQQPQQQHPALAQMYHSSPNAFFHQALHNIPYQHLLGHVPVTMPSYPYPSSSLPQPLSGTSLSSVPQPPLPHHQMSRPSSTSSSSSSSSMSVSSSQEPESLPTTSKVTISKSKRTKGKTGVEVLKRYMCSIHDNLDAADCCICFNKLSEASSYGDGQADAHEAVELNKCRHQFHKLCLLEMYNSIHKDDSLQCPSCKTIYGEKTGNCPPGYMQWRLVNELTIPGYEGHGAIIVSYHISAGTQGPEHPNPGQSYSARGFPRQGFLPDCSKGRKVLKLLMEAFRRRLMFTIATSSTTGEINTVTWNEIHHKTEPHGNRSGHGYPDPQYLDNVLMELASHGVTEDCL